MLGGELGSILRVPFAQAEVCLLMKSQTSLPLARKSVFSFDVVWVSEAGKLAALNI